MTDASTPPGRRRLLGETAVVYRSRRPVGEAVFAKLTAAAQALNEQHDWWAEGLAVRREPGGVVEGTTRLSLVGYEAADGEPVEVDDDQDAFMAWMDLAVVVDFLADRSAELGIDFEVAYAGEAVGKIVRGEPDEALDGFVVTLGESVEATFEEADEERATAHSEAHRDRLTCVAAESAETKAADDAAEQ